MPSQSLTDLFQVSAKTVVDDRFVTRLLNTIELRFRALELLQPRLDAGLKSMLQVALDRVNEVLTPAIRSILVVQEHGYLVASVTTDSAAAMGNTIIANIGDADERAVFVASKFVILTRADNPDDYAILLTSSYDNTTGDYIGQVVAQAGDPGPHEDWQINGVAGSTIAQLMLLEIVEQLHAQVAGNAQSAAGAAVATNADRLAVAADKAAILAAVVGGPVLQVAGLNGIIGASALRAALGLSDVATPSDITAAIAGLKGDASAALDTLEELAAALGDDANFAGTVTAALAAKADASAVLSRSRIVARAIAYGG